MIDSVVRFRPVRMGNHFCDFLQSSFVLLCLLLSFFRLISTAPQTDAGGAAQTGLTKPSRAYSRGLDCFQPRGSSAHLKREPGMRIIILPRSVVVRQCVGLPCLRSVACLKTTISSLLGSGALCKRYSTGRVLSVLLLFNFQGSKGLIYPYISPVHAAGTKTEPSQKIFL